MESLKIILLSILAAIIYGILHDQVTARVCVEYFTIGHPPIFNTNSPTLLGISWGIVATWWVGALLGVPLALVAQAGARPKLNARRLVVPIAKLLIVMGLLAFIAGCTCVILLHRGIVVIPDYIVKAIPEAARVPFMADWWAHMMSYLAGFVGGLVLMVQTWRRRKLENVPPGQGGSAC